MRTMLLVLALFSVSGCNKKRVSAKAPASFSAPVEISWKNDWEFYVKGAPASVGHILLDKTFVTVSVRNFPPGTALELGGDKTIVGDYGSATVKLDAKEKIGQLPVDLNNAKLDPGASLVIKPADLPPITLPLPPQSMSYKLDDILKKAENGPVLFGKDDKHEGPPRSILIVTQHDKPVFGPATVLADVDAFAFERILPEVKTKKVCGGYSSGGKKMPDLTVLMKDVEVTVYDRRTGSIFKKQVFAPDPACPMFVMTRTNQNTVDSTKDSEAIKAWLRTLVQR
jgi:hypothetical protein